MANEIAENRSLSSLPRSFETPVADRTSMPEISRLIARCVANFGERKGADMRLMATEWQAQLGKFPTDRLHVALDRHIRRSSYWPTVADLIDQLERDALRLGLPLHRDEENKFCREGRTEAEEIAYRAGQVARMKARHGFGVRSRCDGQDAP